MAKTSAPKQHNVPTTNFVINLDKININALQEKYRLFTIEVPKTFKHFADNTKSNPHALLHNAYKEQLDYPYFFLSPDGVPPIIYVLVEKSNFQQKPISLTLDFLDKKPINAQEIKFLEICNEKNLHILAKLFLSSWYHKAHRTCQGDYFFIHSKDDKYKATALLVKIKSSKNKGEFEITASSAFLLKIYEKSKPEYAHWDTYLEKLQGEIYYRQVKSSEVVKRLNENKDLHLIFRQVNKRDTDKFAWLKRPSIKWYDSKNFQGCRSELLRNFQNELVAYYNEVFGEDVAEKRSHFMTQVVPMEHTGNKGKGKDFVNGYAVDEKTGKSIGLYWKILDKVGVLDLRQKDVTNPNQNNFEDYINMLNKQYVGIGISFSEIKREDLSSTTKPILVLQDVEKQLFEDDGFLFNLACEDQKREIYQEFASKIPMQTLNINLNKADDFNSSDAYFEYAIFKFEDYKHRLDVCLHELLLKKYIINKLPIYNDTNLNHSLPCLFNLKSLRKDFVYMYQNTFMYVDNQYVLQFLNLDNPNEKHKRNEFLKNWGIDWFQFEKQFADRNYTRNENGQNKTYQKNGETKDKHEESLKRTHFVFAKELVLAIEETEERVIYNKDAYDETGKARGNEAINALKGIYFSETENIYTVGLRDNMNQSMDKSVKVRRLHYYQKPDNFEIDALLQTLSVQFVRNKQYTVYPYFFDLLNLYRKDVQQTEQDE
jgi:hypothetical protein